MHWIGLYSCNQPWSSFMVRSTYPSPQHKIRFLHLEQCSFLIPWQGAHSHILLPGARGSARATATSSPEAAAGTAAAGTTAAATAAAGTAAAGTAAAGTAPGTPAGTAAGTAGTAASRAGSWTLCAAWQKTWRLEDFCSALGILICSHIPYEQRESKPKKPANQW